MIDRLCRPGTRLSHTTVLFLALGIGFYGPSPHVGGEAAASSANWNTRSAGSPPAGPDRSADITPSDAVQQVDDVGGLPDEFRRPANWRLHASGDEVLSLAVHPTTGEYWSGTDGGGLVRWSADGTFTVYSSVDTPGLTSDVIHGIAFDPHGRTVWLATDRGLSVGEGADGAAVGLRWSTHLHRGWAPEVPVTGLVAHDDGQLPDTRVFSAVVVTSDGTVVAGTPSQGVVVRAVDGTWRHIPSVAVAEAGDEPPEGPGAASVAALALLPARDGGPAGAVGDEVWMVHGRGNQASVAYSRFRPSDGRWWHGISGAHGDDPKDGPLSALVMDVTIDPVTGVVWLGTWNDGVYRLSVTEAGMDPDAFVGRWRHFPRGTDGLCEGETARAAWRIATKGGRTWVACGAIGSSREVHGSVSAFDGSGWHTEGRLAPEDGRAPTALAVAADGTVLVGTDDQPGPLSAGGGGIYALGTGDRSSVRHLRTAGQTPERNELTSVAVDDSGSVWVGTAGGGLLRRLPGEGWTRYTTESTGGRLVGNWVTDIAVHGGRVWVGTTETLFDARAEDYTDGGLSVWDTSTERWTAPLRPSAGSTDGLVDGQVSSVAVGEDGTVWMGLGAANRVPRGSFNGQGVVAWTPDEAAGWDAGKWRWWGPSDLDRIAGRTVLGIATTGGEVWLAASYGPNLAGERSGGGVARWSDGQWRTWRAGDEGLVTYHDGPLTGDVRTVATGRDGTVWIGTYEADPDRLIGQWPLVTAVVATRLPGADDWTVSRFPQQGWITSVREDTLGRVWAGTTRSVEEERWPATGVRDEWTASPLDVDAARAGAFVRTNAAGPWVALEPSVTGLTARQVVDIAVDPVTGHVWLATAHGGLIEYTVGITGPLAHRIALPVVHAP